MEESNESTLSREQIEQARLGLSSLQATLAASKSSAMPLRLHVLASGSKGNASIVQNAETGEGVFIDCGICKRDVLSRCEEAGFDLKNLRAVLVTHEHTDHTKGLKVLYRELVKRGIEAPLYVNEASLACSKQLHDLAGLAEFESMREGDQLSLAGMEIVPFATSHDAACSFGFRFWTGSDALGFMTDTGTVTGTAHDALKDCRILAIEANHDPQMLKNGPYPRALQERVASDRGHLSNGQSADELAALLHPGLERVVAMHISENNNTYRLPVESLRVVLEREGHDAVAVCSYQQRLASC